MYKTAPPNNLNQFDLIKYRQFIVKQLLCRATYKKLDITDILLESLYQFSLAPSTYLKQLPQIVVSRKHRQMFNLVAKPSSAQTNDWLLYNFGYKYCNICKQALAIENYKKDVSKWDKLQPICVVCSSRQYAEYRVNNPEYSKTYQQNNYDKIKQYKREYRHANLAVFAAYSAKRRASKLKATPSWLTDKQKDEIAIFYTEAAKLTKSTGVIYHVDHIVPLQGKNVCGLHVPWNLQVITATENVRKNNKYPA